MWTNPGLRPPALPSLTAHVTTKRGCWWARFRQPQCRCGMLGLRLSDSTYPHLLLEPDVRESSMRCYATLYLVSVNSSDPEPQSARLRV